MGSSITEPLFETELLPHQTTDSVEFFQIYVQFVIRICLAAQPVKSIFQLNKFCPGGLETSCYWTQSQYPVGP